jgi:hypothetical protein
MKQQIKDVLGSFAGADLRAASIGLLNSLGYQSKKTLDLGNTPNAFLAEFDKRDRKFRKDKALFDRWKSVEFLFQITDDEVRNAGTQGTLFDSGYDHGNYQSYLFFALDLKKNHYTRTQFADITREINLLFDMPAMLLMRHDDALTFSIIDRRLHKKDQSRDVLEKVKLIKDIRYQEPHRAHIEILHDLSLQALMSKHECRDFKQLHEAWRTTLDINELNKKFYRELADWYFWTLDHVDFPADVEKDTATRNATNVIRLLTRLIFCWFLKEKGLIPADLFSERKLSGVLKSLKDEDSTFYQAILQNLFFGTLNQRMNTGGRENRRFANDGAFLERKDEYGVKSLYRYQNLFAITEEEAVKLFSDIPFLNGGLFDCLDKEDDSGKVLYVDGFTRNVQKLPKVPNFLFFSNYRTLDLSDAYGDKKKKKEKVRGLINLLDSYKFTITENTPIEEEIALDPELLGKVFENLLASYNPETGTTARKQTGSFYTPREIVNYMVDESLIAYLEGQLKAKVPKLAEMKDLQNLLREVFAYTEKAHPFDEEEVEALIDAIDTCKILDPACGSGAFPMGILHKLVFILGKIDPNNKRWKQRQIAKAEQIPDVSAREIAVSAIEKDFETNDLDYGRKLYLIENCIYGVDIQPIAIQISKLRFFISLTCDQRTNKNKAQNCGVRPLPNLETKFVAANTLISLDRGKGQQLPMTDPRLPKLESELAAVRHRHFAVQRRRDKLALQKRDAEIRKKIAGVLAGGGMSGEASHQLAAWDPYDQNSSAPFFDPEWMFGVMDGFHIVIGNPPYGLVGSDQRHAREYYTSGRFKLTAYKINLYVLFLERGLELQSVLPGMMSFIIPKSLVFNAFFEATRRQLLERFSIPLIVELKGKVFDSAEVGGSVLFFACGHSTRPTELEYRILGNVIPGSEVLSTQTNSQAALAATPGSVFRVSGVRLPQTRHTLGDLWNVSNGLNPGNVRHILLSDSKLTPRHRKLLLGRDLQRYELTWSGTWVNYDPSLKDTIGPNETRSKKGMTAQARVDFALRDSSIYKPNKVMVRKTADHIVGSLDSEGFCFDSLSYGIRPKTGEYDPKFLLGLLNSKYVGYMHAELSQNQNKVFAKVLAKNLRRLPMPDVDLNSVQDCAEYDTIVALVDRILEKKQGSPDANTTALERDIDAHVYRIYGLTQEEIAIVEDKSV